MCFSYFGSSLYQDLTDSINIPVYAQVSGGEGMGNDEMCIRMSCCKPCNILVIVCIYCHVYYSQPKRQSADIIKNVGIK